MLLGAGRETVDSRVDPAVGVVLNKKVGDLVIAGESVVTLHVNERRRLPEALAILGRAVELAPEAPPAAPLIRLVLN
jgi:thymidine phosphorylase